MSRLSDAQAQFAEDIAQLISWITSLNTEHNQQVYRVRWGDCFRDPRCPYGHPRSLHRRRLAVDLMLDRWNGQKWVYQTKTSAYQPLGDYWKAIRPQNAWGGDFVSVKDGNHFSRQWGRQR